jgi:ChrR Cupin-like domain
MGVLTRDFPLAGELARRSVVYADGVSRPADGAFGPTLEDYPDRATLLCRLGPGRQLPVDAVRNGLEILVVEGGIECDGVLLGQYGYARRPRGTNPTVTATKPTILFVKRGHIPPEDRIETTVEPHPALWQAEPGSGLPTLPLHNHGDITVALRQFPAGSAPTPRRSPGGEEILVLDGTLLDERSAYPRGSWIRNPPGSLYQPYSVEGCLVYAQTGHLPVI